MEAIRLAGSVALGIAADPASAARIASVPKVAMIAPPADATLLSGATMPAAAMDLAIRMISVGQPHRAVPRG